MPSPLVSVIIPTYNRATQVSATVDSVVAQTHRNWEIVLVDDGSKDNTGEVVAQRYGNEPRVRYIRQENQGVSAARNTGITAAEGDFICFLDSDDIWEQWKLEAQLACFSHSPEIGMVWTDMTAVSPSGQVLYPRYLHVMYAAYHYFTREKLFARSYPLAEVAPQLTNTTGNTRFYTGEIFSQMIMGNMVHTSTVMLSRERIEKVKEFRLDLRPSGEDYDFHLRTCREGPVGFVDVSSVRYQIGGADQLTAPGYMVHIARNFLRTIEPIIERDRDRIKLSPPMLREVLSYGHSWLGRELLLNGERTEARTHFREALDQKYTMQTAALYAASLLPGSAIQNLRSAYRKYIKPMRKRATAATA